ncbi:MAG TPA: hypothetical protein VEC96_10785, partial [Anaerolineae bacterium]|nr:hypothetical protein [Anaerolineae bacterium]
MATSLELAITAIRSGRKEEGRQLLNLLIQQNPNNEMAWLWMSSVVNSDEQRARCLYHVLAINPDNELARRGLQLLGIVVSDSRPVKVPRDSQPIPIQKPQPEGAEPAPWPIPPAPTPDPTKTQPLIQLPQPEQKSGSIPTTPPHQTGPLEERRPFRIDPRAITQELPFTPLREPFAEPARRSPSAFAPRVEADQQVGNAPPPAPATDQAALQPGPNPQPPGSLPSPSEPVPVMALAPVQNWGEQASAAPNVTGQVPATPAADTGSLPNPAAPANQPVAAPPPPQSFGPGMAVNETRPSQPIWVAPGNAPPTMPQPAVPNNNQPPYAASGLNSNVTMGMPTHYLQPQNSLPGMPAIHS